MMLSVLIFTLGGGLYIDADAPCDPIEIRGVIQLGDHYFLLDKGVHQVKVTDERGGLLYHFGQKGEGPGEFQHPSAIGGVNGEVWVHDLVQSHVQRFSAKGAYLGVHKINALGPLQFEPQHMVLHTPTQSRMFTVLDNEFKELGKVGKGMDATGGVKVDQIVHFLKVFSIDPEHKKLYSVGVNGKAIASYDLRTMTEQSTRDLPLRDYTISQKVKKTERALLTKGGRPVKGMVFHDGRLYILVADETKQEHARLLILNDRGKLLENRKLARYYTQIIGNTGHGSAFFINHEESLIEERPLALTQK